MARLSHGGSAHHLGCWLFDPLPAALALDSHSMDHGSEWSPPHRFFDRAVSGPYPLWHHKHWFAAHNEGTMMRDRVTYALPLGG